MSKPLMPKATAVWLIENTALTFEQIADYCELHELEVQSIADEEKTLATETAAMINARDGVPQVGVFDFWNVDLNYLDLRWMAKFAMQHEQDSIDRIEGHLDMVADDPEVASFLRRAIDQKKEHLEKLATIKGDYGDA